MRIVVYIFAFLAIVPTFANAASLQINPEYPEPFENFTVSVKLEKGEYAPELSWFVDDKLQKEKGLKINLKAKDFGEETRIKALLSYAEKAPEVLTLKINPLKVNIIYEAETFTPDFLSLAPRASFGSKLKLQAIAEVKGYKTKDLLFVWKKNGQKLPYLSGLGKDNVELNTDFYSKSQFIELEIWDPLQNTMLAKSSKFILIEKPELEFYLKSKSLGWLFEKSLSNTLYLNNKEEVLAVPFMFSVDEIFSPLLDWVWSVNGRKLKSQESKSPYVEISFRTKEVGQASVELFARHIDLPLQYTNYIIRLERNAGKNKLIHELLPKEKPDSGFGI